MLAFGSLLWVAPPLVDGSLAVVALLLGAAVLAAWAAVALDTERMARRHAHAGDAAGSDGGAIELLWLAPLAIVGSVALWAPGGSLARPEETLSRYVADWRNGDARAATDAARLVLGATPELVAAAWTTQDPRIANALGRAAGAAGPDAGIDPRRPFESIRFETAGAAEGATPDGDGTDPGRRLVRVGIVRRDAVAGSFFGLFPTTTQRLVEVETLGTIALVRLERPAGRPLLPADAIWLIERVDLAEAPLP